MLFMNKTGQIIPCLPGICTNTATCSKACKSKGYKGGACVRNVGSNTGVCCCRVGFESQDASISTDSIAN